MAKQSQPKQRIPLWMYPETIKLADSLYPLDNCKSRSEFIDNATRFYAGYLISNHTSEFLTESVLDGINGAVHDSENRQARLLFKLAVELGILTRILAQYDGITEASLSKIRSSVVDELKRTNGTIQLTAQNGPVGL